MLTDLSIQNLVTIDGLSLSLDPGLTVLTGETGAGKSILLDALSLVLGERADISMIRFSKDQAVISACFDANNTINILLSNHGITVVDDTVLLRRIIDNKGKNRQFINDQPVTLTLLKLVAEDLVELHGQFDRLFSPNQYRDALDVYGRYDDLLNCTSKTYHLWQQAKKRYETFLSNTLLSSDEIIHLSKDIESLKKLAPQENEEDTLITERDLLANDQKNSDLFEKALAYIDGNQALLFHYYELEKIISRLDDQKLIQQGQKVLSEVCELKETLLEQLERINANPKRLEEIDQRLMELRAAARKFRIDTNGLLSLLSELEEKLLSVNNREGLEIDLKNELKTTVDAYLMVAKELSEKRQQMGKTLANQIKKELPELKLSHADFEVTVEQLSDQNYCEKGIDKVDFLFTANPGNPLRSLGKVASGGELSRLMLALKVVLSQNNFLTTIIFDEIDTGVGGAVATSIGQKLKRLSHSRQVIAITHSPQVAACADNHFIVKKKIKGSETISTVTKLTKEERINEIARMLSGDTITEEAKQAAIKLLQSS